jgi:hypothetical protein
MHEDSPREYEDRTSAARLLGYVDGRLSALEAHREYAEQHEYDEVIVALRSTLGESGLTNLMHEGRSWNEKQAVALTMLIQ